MRLKEKVDLVYWFRTRHGKPTWRGWLAAFQEAAEEFLCGLRDALYGTLLLLGWLILGPVFVVCAKLAYPWIAFRVWLRGKKYQPEYLIQYKADWDASGGKIP